MSVRQLRSRVHAAAGRIDIPPVDVDAVVTRAAAGQGRHRRGQPVLAAAAAVVVVVAGATVWRSGMLEPADTRPARATPKALAAVALEHLDVHPSSFEKPYEPPKGSVGVEMRFHAGGDSDGDLLSVAAAPGKAPKGFCKGSSGCETIDSDAGDVRLMWQEEAPEEDPGIVLVLLQEEDEFHVAYYSGESITGDPRDQDMEISVDDLVDIVTDRRFGLTTTQSMRDADVPGWPGEKGKGSDEALVRVTPKAVAGEMLDLVEHVGVQSAYAADVAEFGPGAVGATIELEPGGRVTMVVVPEPLPEHACPEGWECERIEPSTRQAWTPGQLRFTHRHNRSGNEDAVERRPAPSTVVVTLEHPVVTSGEYSTYAEDAPVHPGNVYELSISPVRPEVTESYLLEHESRNDVWDDD